MYPGQWTSILFEYQPVEAIRKIAEVGWPGIELSTEHINMIADANEPFAAADEVRETVEAVGIRMPQVHLTISLNIADLDASACEAALQVAERDVELCARMGIENGVIHPGGAQPGTLAAFAEEKRVRVDSFKRLAEYAAERQRLLYVGITRARRELIITWNTGRRGDQQPAVPFIALQTFWEQRAAL